MKYFVCFLYLFLFAGIAQSQSVLLEHDQSSVFIESGVARGFKSTILELNVGATYQGTLDLGITIGKVNNNISNYWTLGQFASVIILSETSKDNITSNLSINQGFSTEEGIRRLSLGAAFSIISRLSIESSLLFSLGFNRSMSLSSGYEGYKSIIIKLSLAVRDRKTLYQFSPFATVAEDNLGTYGVTISLSSLVSNRE